ncbi:histone-lysine N-methyltransferase MECOM-like [Electrophorus electricus]|uniref:histone-lysine N-methyltransferase MECOM-like n=1 Tax=Electrophorus electricus TaxID=8005 RepID=UPI0015D0BA27|nr:histone-lysine N-methyltransferase MECOM-like [Electrophorus electricus]
MHEEEDSPCNSAGLECGQAPTEEDQMAEEQRGACAAEVRAGGAGWPRELACSLCKRLFSSLLQLREHEYGHTLSLMALSLDCLEQQRPPAAAPSLAPAARYRCSRCPASFTLKSNADRHEKTIHFNRKRMRCAYCLKHFRDRTDLNRHLSSVHSSERVYACPACARTFSTQKNLATHTKICCQAASGPAKLLWSSHALEADGHGERGHAPSGD